MGGKIVLFVGCQWIFLSSERVRLEEFGDIQTARAAVWVTSINSICRRIWSSGNCNPRIDTVAVFKPTINQRWMYRAGWWCNGGVLDHSRGTQTYNCSWHLNCCCDSGCNGGNLCECR